MPTDFSKIPQELRDLPRWIGWRYEERNGQKTKVPYNARTLELASSTNPAHWTTFSQVLKNGKYFRGPGLVIAPPYMGIDLDQCRDPKTGDAEPWAWNIINELNSYTEVSPSGRGFHIWVKATMPVRGRKKKMANTFVLSAEGKSPAIEVYRDGRYFTMSAQRLEDQPVLSTCGSCEGSGLMDSGGVTMWDAPINIRCECTYGPSWNVEARDLSAWLLGTFGEITEAELAEATYTPADPDGDNDSTASGEEFRIACAVVRDLGIGATRDQLYAEFLKRAKPRAKLKRK